MVLGKTAYVNGEKVEGTVPEILANQGSKIISNVSVDAQNRIMYSYKIFKDTLYRANANIITVGNNVDVVKAIGLTSDMIVAGNTVLGVEGTAEVGGNTCIQTEGGQYQNIAILKQDYQPVLLDDIFDDDYEGDDTGVTGRIIGCVIDDSDFKITMDFVKEGRWIGTEDPVMAIKFYNDSGEEIPELCMYDVVMEGLGTTLTTGKVIATALLTPPSDWQRVIRSATSYKLYFTSF